MSDEGELLAGAHGDLPASPVGHPPEFHLNLLGAIQGLLTIVVVAIFVLTFLAQPFRIPSESMEPTLLIGDFVLVDKVAFAPAGAWHWLLPYKNVQRGDVVVFRRLVPEGEEYLVKRIVAMPGDRLRLQDGRVLLRGQPQDEPYAMFLPSGPDAYRDEFPASVYMDAAVDPKWWVQMHRLVQNGSLVVPQASYFAMGDNRNHSLDSRYWGFVDRQQILGPARLIYFSLRSPSPDDAELQQDVAAQAAPNGKVKKRTDLSANRDSGFARWDRVFHIVR